MKFIRFLFTCVVLIVVLAALACAVAFVPLVQTWAAQSALDRQPGLQGTIGSVWIAFGKLQASDVRIVRGTSVLTLPSLEASLPLITAARDHRVLVGSLVAKGWVLDLTSSPDLPKPGATPPPISSGVKGSTDAHPSLPRVSAQDRAKALVRGFFHGWTLPFDCSVDGVDLEGDVVVPSPGSQGFTHVHVLVSGGGLSAGHPGDFSVEVSAPVTDPRVPYVAASAKGHLAIRMPTPRTMDRLEFKGDFNAVGAPFPALSGTVALDRSSGQEELTVGLVREGQALASFLTHYSPVDHRLEGAWTLNLRDSDITPFSLSHPLPGFVASGSGAFDTDLGFTQVHVTGRMKGDLTHLGALYPPLEPFGAVNADSHFDILQDGSALKIAQFEVTFAGSTPLFSLRLVQPFHLDEKTGALNALDPNADWARLSVQSFPLASLAGATGSMLVSGGDASGDFTVRPAGDGFALRPVTPLTAHHVALSSNGRVLAEHLDVALSLLVDYTSSGWQIQASPLVFSVAGARLATIQIKTTRTGASDEPFACTGTWDADVATLQTMPGFQGLPRIGAKSASGEFSVTLGDASQFEGKVKVVGHDADHSLSASVTGGIDGQGRLEFLAPILISFGSEVSDFTAEGSVGRDDAGPHIELKVTGPRVFVEQAKLLTGPLIAASGLVIPIGFGPENVKAASPVRDLKPFWRDWSGVLRLGIDRLEIGKQEVKTFGGTLELDASGLRLHDGRMAMSEHSVATLSGALTFAADAEIPYSLSASYSVDHLEASSLFGTTQSGDDPIIEGRYAVVRSLKGTGINLGDLINRTHEELKLTSTVGIVRVLKTNIGAAIPQENTPVADSVGAVGSAIGGFLGATGGHPRHNPVSKTADAVLEFINQISEIGYDQVSVSAIEDPNGSIRLTEISMVAPDERVTGSGEIDYVKGVPLADRPMSVDLKLLARHRPGELIAAAGLPTFGKDTEGFTILSQSIHLGGSLLHIDTSQWHDYLAKAATVKPPEKKKGS